MSEELLPFIYRCPECGRVAIHNRVRKDRDKQLWCGNPAHDKWIDVVWIGHTGKDGS